MQIRLCPILDCVLTSSKQKQAMEEDAKIIEFNPVHISYLQFAKYTPYTARCSRLLHCFYYDFDTERALPQNFSVSFSNVSDANKFAKKSGSQFN